MILMVISKLNDSINGLTPIWERATRHDGSYRNGAGCGDLAALPAVSISKNTTNPTL